MEETDILALLRNEIKEQHFVSLVLSYDAVDQKHRFPPGTTKKYIAKAADECGYDVEMPERPEDDGWVGLRSRADGVIPKRR